MELIQKLSILADAAKYDASCASSGSVKRTSFGGQGIGSTTGMGICHSYAPDGRCISLLKILLTNFCIYDCLYCVNRHSSNVPRARFKPEEVVSLTLEFYKRNYIEGLFLSSGIIRNPDYTMEQLIAVAKSLREDFHFQGYIHLKTIPDADPVLLQQAGLYADRLSINIELPTQQGLQKLAPEKNTGAIEQSMGLLKSSIDEGKEAKKQFGKTKRLNKPASNFAKKHSGFLYAPAGQSTQMIVGADGANDLTILNRSSQLYQSYRMRRVYYSAFSPIPSASSQLPLQAPPLMREHRLYQADWLLRFYQFNVDELLKENESDMLDLDIDPKLSWALRHRDFFPVDVNKASPEMLLRVPGLGPRSVQKIVSSRRFRQLRMKDLQSFRLEMKKIKPFICAADYKPPLAECESISLRRQFSDGASQQMTLFS